MTILFQSKFTRAILPFIAFVFFLSCQKDLSNENALGGSGITPDLVTKVNSSVTGFVTDENNLPVLGASVTAGTGSATTDKYGYFEINNVQVVKTAAVVTVNKPGYFKGIKTYLAENNKAAFFRIKLMPKTNEGSISGSTGGSVTLSNGLIIALPANGVVNASTSAAYTGSVNVAVKWIDPTATDLNQTMPGDLRGITTDGKMKVLTTYGMAAVELTGTSGELLQIASGKKATLTIPVPAAISGTAPSTIPLWSFDETNGLWKEEGQATKTGNTYVGEVSHFSFWNCDVPNNYVQFNCTVHDSQGNPIHFAAVKISQVSNPFNARYGYTDTAGYVSGLVPDNSQLLVEIYGYYDCGTALYSQTITTSNAAVSLGTITLPTSLGTATVSGTVTDCNNNPVTNGYVIVLEGYQYYHYALVNGGNFSFTKLLCNGASTTVTVVAGDITGAQQSTPINVTLVPGNNVLGNLQACGISTQQFITYSINGGAPINIVAPGDSIMQSGAGSTVVSYISGSQAGGTNYVNFAFNTSGIAVGSTQPLQSFFATQFGNTQTTVSAPLNVNITEYGAVGQFMSGNFTGVVINPTPPTINYNVVCSFRVRRNF